MKSFKIVFLFLVIFCISLDFCFGAVGIFGIHKSKNKEGYCEYKGVLIKRSESKPSKVSCLKYHCADDYNISEHT